jgi:hypothetical protein
VVHALRAAVRAAAFVSSELRRAASRLGMAIAAMMAMIATTIIISISVNPFFISSSS